MWPIREQINGWVLRGAFCGQRRFVGKGPWRLRRKRMA